MFSNTPTAYQKTCGDITPVINKIITNKNNFKQILSNDNQIILEGEVYSISELVITAYEIIRVEQNQETKLEENTQTAKFEVEALNLNMDHEQMERILLWTINNIKYQGLYREKNLFDYSVDYDPVRTKEVNTSVPVGRSRNVSNTVCSHAQSPGPVIRTQSKSHPGPGHSNIPSFSDLSTHEVSGVGQGYSYSSIGNFHVLVPDLLNTNLPVSPMGPGSCIESNILSSIPSIKKKFYIREFERKRAFLTMKRSQKILDTIEKTKQDYYRRLSNHTSRASFQASNAGTGSNIELLHKPTPLFNHNNNRDSTTRFYTADECKLSSVTCSQTVHPLDRLEGRRRKKKSKRNKMRYTLNLPSTVQSLQNNSSSMSKNSKEKEVFDSNHTHEASPTSTPIPIGNIPSPDEKVEQIREQRNILPEVLSVKLSSIEASRQESGTKGTTKIRYTSPLQPTNASSLFDPVKLEIDTTLTHSNKSIVIGQNQNIFNDNKQEIEQEQQISTCNLINQYNRLAEEHRIECMKEYGHGEQKGTQIQISEINEIPVKRSSLNIKKKKVKKEKEKTGQAQKPEEKKKIKKKSKQCYKNLMDKLDTDFLEKYQPIVVKIRVMMSPTYAGDGSLLKWTWS